MAKINSSSSKLFKNDWLKFTIVFWWCASFMRSIKPCINRNAKTIWTRMWIREWKVLYDFNKIYEDWDDNFIDCEIQPIK